LCLALLILGGFLAYLQTESGRALVASNLSNLLSSEPDMRVTIERIEGFVPFRLEVPRATVHDAAGAWLTLEDLQLVWSPTRLAAGRLHVEQLTASKITLSRVPPGKDDEADEKPFTLPESLPPVTVEHLAVRELSLGEAVAGQAGVFEIKGSLLESDDKPGLTVSLHVLRTDEGPKSRADIEITPRTQPASLAVRIELNEEESGWVASALGLENAGPIAMSLVGDGSPQEWRGVLSGNVAGYGSLRADISAQAAEQEKQLGLSGTYETSPSFPSKNVSTLLGTDSRFQISLRFTPAKSLTVERIDLESKNYALHLAGTLDLASRNLESSWTLAMKDISVLEGFVGSPVAGELSLQGALSGSISKPVGEVTARVSDLRAQQVSARTVETVFRFEPLAASAPAGKGFKLSATGSARELVALEGPPLPERSLQWSFEAKAPGEGNLTISALRIEGEKHLLKLKGEIDASKVSGSLESTLYEKSTGATGSAPGESLHTVAEVEARMSGKTVADGTEGHIEGRLTHMERIPTRFAPLVGPELTFNSTFSLRGKDVLTVSQLDMKSPAFHLKSNGSLDLAKEAIEAKWQLGIPKLEHLSTLLERPVSGSMEAEGALEGTFSALKSTVTLKGSGIGIDGRSLTQVTSTVNAANITEAPEGNFRIDLRQGKQQLTASTDFHLKQEQLNLSKLTLEAPGGKINGEMAVDLAKPLLSGNLEGKFKDVSSLGSFAGERMGGSGEIKATFLHGKQGQDLKLTLKSSGLATDYGKVGSFNLSADLTDILQTPQGKASLKVRELEQAGFALATLDLDASGDKKGMNFDLAAKGKMEERFDVRSRATLSSTKAGYQLQVSTLSGNFEKYPFRLVQPLVAEQSPDGMSLKGLSLAFGKGRIEASASSTSKNVSFTGELEDLPLGLIETFGGPDLRGSAAGRIRLEGNPSKPSGSFELRFAGLRYGENNALKSLQGAQLTADGKIENSRLALDFELIRQAEKPAWGNLSLPLTLSFVPFSFSMDPQGSIDGHIEGRTDLTTITTLFPLEGHKLTGPVSASFDIGGVLSDPQIRGSGGIESSTYENYTYGTVLKDLSASVRAQGERLEIESVRATDGGNGSISASGWVNLEEEGFPLRLEARASEAKLMRRDDLNSSASGELTISGTAQKMEVTGKLKVESAEYILPKRQPTAIARLNVIEINGPSKAVRQTETQPGELAPSKEKPAPLSANLDLGVSFPSRAFVRGRGLNSEWSGDLRITGSASEPSLVGKLSVVRGDYDFLGKPFKLESGFIQFYGGTPIAPVIDITAVTKAKDITARLVISGPASDPKITMESDPPLPQDEVFSRILFNRSLTQLTPIQAVRLANAVRALSGRGDALDFMERAREFLKVEQLELRESDDKAGDFALGVGKYLTEDIYVDVEKGVGNETGKLSVEVELAPHLTLESEAGLNTGKGVGLNWKLDY
jgi:translocation and assembly module TamB